MKIYRFKLNSNATTYFFFKFVQSMFINIIKLLVFLLHLDKFVCQHGFNNLVIREISYKGKVTYTNLYILANNKFPIESQHTLKYNKDTNFFGISLLAARSIDCIDIGANVGTHSLLMAQYCTGIVLAFEPASDIFFRLEKNILANNMNSKIQAYQLGISDKSETLHYASTNKNPGNGHLFKARNELQFNDPNHLGEIFSDIMCDSLDNQMVRLSDQLTSVDFVKIDIESMEYLAVLGGMATITKFMPALLIETTAANSDVRGWDCITPIFTTLYSLGYESFTFKNLQFEKFIYPNFTGDTFFLTKKHLATFH